MIVYSKQLQTERGYLHFLAGPCLPAPSSKKSEPGSSEATNSEVLKHDLQKMAQFTLGMECTRRRDVSVDLVKEEKRKSCTNQQKKQKKNKNKEAVAVF